MGYAFGFAAGNYIGILIEEKLAIGTLIIRVFLVNDDGQMRTRMKEAGFGVTTIDAHGKTGNVKILYIVIKRKFFRNGCGRFEDFKATAFTRSKKRKRLTREYFPQTKNRPSLS